MKLLAPMLMAAALAGCAMAPRAPDAPELRTRPDRLILVTVANPAAGLPAHAGSTARGYDLAPAYAVSAAARTAAAGLAADFGLREITAWPIAALRVHCLVYEIPPQAARDTLLTALARDPRVRLAQPLQSFMTLGAGYNDPYFGLQHALVEIDAAGAQEITRGEGVRVALIDTGVDAAHPDLAGRVALQKNFVDGDEQQFLRDRHGTGVAGIIAAVANNHVGIVGVAPGVALLVFKACWQEPAGGGAARCNSFTLAQALAAALEAGAQVINLSLGGPADALLAQLVSEARRRGVIVVGAVPPDGRRDGFPLGVEGVLAVDVSGGHEDAVSLRAPGREVLTLTPGGHYDYASGSSLAAAHVTGAVALLLAQDPHVDAVAAQALLRRAGGGINICAALSGLHATSRCATSTVAAPAAHGGALP